MHQPEVTLPLDDATIEAIAVRVVECLQRADPVTPRMLTAQEVAAQYGLTRAWVYQHAVDLGATRIGGGRRPRLRFDATEVARRLSPPPPTPVKRRRRRAPATGDHLLPVYGRSAG